MPSITRNGNRRVPVVIGSHRLSTLWTWPVWRARRWIKRHGERGPGRWFVTPAALRSAMGRPGGTEPLRELRPLYAAELATLAGVSLWQARQLCRNHGRRDGALWCITMHDYINSAGRI